MLPNSGVLLIEFAHEANPHVGGTVVMIDLRHLDVARLHANVSYVGRADGTAYQFTPGSQVSISEWQAAGRVDRTATWFNNLSTSPSLALRAAETSDRVELLRQPTADGGEDIRVRYDDSSHADRGQDPDAVVFRFDPAGKLLEIRGEPAATERFETGVGSIDLIVPVRPQIIAQVRYIPDGSLRDIEFVSHWNENYAAEVNNKLFGEVFEHHTPGEPFDTSTSSPLGSAALIVGSLLALLAIIGLIRKARG